MSGAESINGLYVDSSCGPAKDDRYLPTIVAPGTQVSSARFDASPGGSSVPGEPHYRFRTGTSMAAAHVSGSCALLIEWWRKTHPHVNPSPALLKALLVNGAIAITGGVLGASGAITAIPSNQQGWGRVSIRNTVEQKRSYPASNRGPSIYIDQQEILSSARRRFTKRVRTADPGRSMRVTLCWTDGRGAQNSRPALVNDLDLEVEELDTLRIFKGNRFGNDFSLADGVFEFDHLNNVECVYVKEPRGDYEVTVIALFLRANALPPFLGRYKQDFALVIENAEEL
jgi:hypothetical protein